jgi:hypothetical protein
MVPGRLPGLSAKTTSLLMMNEEAIFLGLILFISFLKIYTNVEY